MGEETLTPSRRTAMVTAPIVQDYRPVLVHT